MAVLWEGGRRPGLELSQRTDHWESEAHATRAAGPGGWRAGASGARRGACPTAGAQAQAALPPGRRASDRELLDMVVCAHGGGGGGGGGRLVSVLLEARAGVNLAARDGNTALHLACLAGNNAAVGAHV